MNTISALAKLDGISIAYILKISRKADYCYKTYTIPKASGGTRTIHHPSKDLKVLQRWISKRFLTLLPVHASATAYMKKCSIKKNAARHAKNRFVLRMDFQDYFESFTYKDLQNLLAASKTIGRHVVDEDDLVIIGSLLLRYGRLTIGAPSSPLLSNIFMYDFDSYICNLASQMDIVYTRYADDIFFSTNTPRILSIMEKAVPQGLNNLLIPNKLVINGAKTRHSSNKGRRQITGIILTDDNRLSIGRKRKRAIKAKIHKLILGQGDLEHIHGLLAFLKDIEPHYIDNLKLKYGHAVIDSIFHKEKL